MSAVNPTTCFGASLLNSIEISTKGGSRILAHFFTDINAETLDVRFQAKGYIAVNDELTELATTKEIPLPTLSAAFMPEVFVQGIQEQMVSELVSDLLEKEAKNGKPHSYHP